MLNTLELQKWFFDKNCDDNAKNAFLNYVDCCEDDEDIKIYFNNISLYNVIVKLLRVSLNALYHEDGINETISVCHSLIYNNKEIGRYTIIYLINGNMIDDYLDLF